MQVATSNIENIFQGQIFKVLHTNILKVLYLKQLGQQWQCVLGKSVDNSGALVMMSNYNRDKTEELEKYYFRKCETGKT